MKIETKRKIIDYLLDNAKEYEIQDILNFLTTTAHNNLSQKRYNSFESKFNQDQYKNRCFNGLVLNGVKYSTNDYSNKKEQMIYSFLSYFDEESLFKLSFVIPRTQIKLNSGNEGEME